MMITITVTEQVYSVVVVRFVSFCLSLRPNL